MNKTLVFLSFLFLPFTEFACDCFISEEPLYVQLRSLDHAFVAKVARKLDTYNYELEIIRVFKGSFKKTLKVYSGNSSSCGMGELATGDIYLFSPFYDKKSATYRVSGCRYNTKNTHHRFFNDTLSLAALSSENGFLNTPYFKGQVKKGKREGLWQEYGYSSSDDASLVLVAQGNFVRDLEEGEWTMSSGEKQLYKKGRVAIPLSETKAENTIDTMLVKYYPDGSPYKALINYPSGSKDYTTYYKVYYPTGIIKEKVKVEGGDLLYGNWYMYDEQGKVIKKIKVTLKDEIPYAAEFFKD